MVEPRKSLSDILAGNQSSTDLSKAFDSTAAAGEYAPLPKGQYHAVITNGQLFTARTGTPGYKLTFEVLDGDHKGRKFWHDLWLTPAAMSHAKRDLAKLGITSLRQLDYPLPARFLCDVKLVLKRNDGGDEYNQVKSFDVTGVEAPDPFAPVEVPA